MVPHRVVDTHTSDHLRAAHPSLSLALNHPQIGPYDLAEDFKTESPLSLWRRSSRSNIGSGMTLVSTPLRQSAGAQTRGLDEQSGRPAGLSGPAGASAGIGLGSSAGAAAGGAASATGLAGLGGGDECQPFRTTFGMRPAGASTGSNASTGGGFGYGNRPPLPSPPEDEPLGVADVKVRVKRPTAE